MFEVVVRIREVLFATFIDKLQEGVLRYFESRWQIKFLEHRNSKSDEDSTILLESI